MKRIVKITFDLLLVGLVCYILWSTFKDKSIAEYGAVVLWILEVLIGLSLLIFFHELGHFVAAKACNVRVEAFSIGMGPSIPGCEFKYGETLYKIGRFPIGGYVKMLGQVDPGEQEEDERAAKEDPRSYMNKTVGQRMVIISAGVVMNVLLGMACFVYVYMAGKVEKVPRFGTIEPGSPAFRAGLEAGSKLLQVDDNANPIYEDLFFASLLATPGSTKIHLKWLTPAGAIHEADVIPIKTPQDSKPRIGVGFPDGLTIIRGEKDPANVTIPGTPAARAGFQSGDKLVGVRTTDQAAFTPLKNGWDLAKVEDALRDKPLVFDVLRGEEHVTITVEPAYFSTLGINMAMGPIRTVPENNFAPAVAKQFEKDDVIVKVGEQEGFDPFHLPDLLRKMADESQAENIPITVRRGDKDVTINVPRKDLQGYGTWTDSPPGAMLVGMGIPALDVSYDVLPKVASVIPGSSAEKAGVKVGDQIRAATVFLGPEKEEKKLKMDKIQWAWVFWLIQRDGNKNVVLHIDRNGESLDIPVTAEEDKTWPLPERGYYLENETQTFQAGSFGEAIQLGFRETKRFIHRMYLSLKSLVVRDVSVTTMAGPVGIVKIAYKTAEQGITELILFLGIISINLAVVNFLPIPILDGGHMVFLIWEKIRGKPASERAIAIATWAGLAIIASLLVFVVFLDLGGRKWLSD